jgi:hypothetical protein
MPARSKKQQRFFGLVHAYKTGRLPANKASRAVIRAAKSISAADAKKYASTSHKGLAEELKAILNSPEYIEESIKDIIETNEVIEIKGQVVDKYTATMIQTVLDGLNENNKKALLSKSLNEIVAVAYKVLTY